MELTSSSEGKLLSDSRNPTNDHNFDNVKTTTVPPSNQHKNLLLVKYKRHLALLTLVYVTLLILIIILVASITDSFCSCRNISDANDNNKNRNSQLLDTENRSCFYQSIRLPKSILPVNYTIYLHPNITHPPLPTFTGYVLIDSVCNKYTNFLVIHAKTLNLSNSSIVLNYNEINKKTEAKILVTSFCSNLDQYYVEFSPACLPNDKLRFKLYFNGIAEKRLDGFYLSDYRTKTKEPKALLTTHMEPTFARQAFPCFDEPFFKANFSLQMVRDKDHYSLFNMPLNYVKYLSNGLFLDSYQPTVRMSTYLVAYMLLPKDYISLNGFDDRNRTQIRIFAPRDQKEYTKYALDVSKKVLPFFEDVFGLQYPLPKLDMIAIPDFSAGAMENWGLITYKAHALLIKPSSNKILHRSSIAKIISHEIAHQWFGNIVTMDWWNDLWLNEGFASYTEYLGGDFANKQWKMLDLFYMDQFVDSMHFDSLINSHPIQVPVVDPQEIEAIFDLISYGKGACLVRMLEGILTLPTLKKGLKIYLNRYRYRNAISDNLWEAFSEAYRENNTDIDKENPLLNLKGVMSTWLNQMNFPVVTVSRTGDDSFVLYQERFLIYPNSTKYWNAQYDSPFNYVWWIPILYKTDQMTEPRLIWLKDSRRKHFKLEKPYKWLKLNYGQKGFFRVNYDNGLWSNLIDELKAKVDTFDSVDRAGLLSDAFALTRAGKLNIKVALNLSTYLVNEKDLVPIYVATDVFNDVTKQLYFDVELSEKFEIFVAELIKSIIKNIRITKWNDENLNAYNNLVQSAVIQLAMRYKVPNIVNMALENYNIYKHNLTITNPNLHHLALQSAVISDTADGTEWQYLYHKSMNSTESDVRRSCRKALAKTANNKLLNKLFNTVMSNSKHQDLVSILFEAAYRNEAGVDQSWLFIQRNWEYFRKNVAQHYFLVSDLFKICNSLLTESDYDQAKTFFTTKQLGFSTRSANQSLEMIRSNIYWNEHNKQHLDDWLMRFSR